MAMMRLARDWQVRQPNSPRITVLTVDHGLRAASADEARQVADWARACGLPHVSLLWEGQKPATGLQAKARAARYGLMSAWCEAHGADWLATAHTLDDQAETVLMRMARTSSLDSLAGIARAGHWGSINLFRPLLDLRREDLRDYLRGIGQPWIDDPSNDDERFERVRIRKALPVLAGIGIGPENLAAIANSAAAAVVEEERLAADWIALHLSESEAGFCHIPARPHLTPPRPIRERVLAAVIRHYGGGHSPERAEIARLADWMDGREGRRTLGGAMVIGRKGFYFVGREWQRIAAAPSVVPEQGSIVWDRRFRVWAPPGSQVVALGQVPGLRSLSPPPFAYLAGGQPALVPPGLKPQAVGFSGDQPVRAEFLELKAATLRLH